MRVSKNNKKVIIIGIVVIVFLTIFCFQFKLNIVNELGHPVRANVSFTVGKLTLWTFENKTSINFVLPIGKYSLKASAEGYQQKQFVLKHTNILEKRIKHNLILSPALVDISKITVVDPTGTIKLSPFISIRGTNILGQEVEQQGVKEFIYGNYNATLTDPHFQGEIRIKGDKFYQYDWETELIKLHPGKNTIWISESDVSYVENFLTDFLNLSSLDYIKIDPGFPQQFYISSKDTTLSLGDIIFVLCEKKLYNKLKIENPTYFVPLNKKYTIVDAVFNVEDCYAHGLTGYLPAQINGRITASELVGPYNYHLYSDEQLNSKERIAPIAFTFDIESGRYVNKNNKGAKAISPCTDNPLSEANEELVCDNADLAGWFSPVVKHTFSQYSYPWVSGILGFKELLNYPQNYGVPLTLYFVDREVKIFKQLAPEIIEQTKELVKENLIEVGSHTTSHTNLAVLNVEETTAMLLKSREFLEETFATNVSSMRGPYFSLVNNNVESHELAVADSGFSYYSQEYYPEEKADSKIINKPFSYVFLSENNQQDLLRKLNTWGYVVTLDHPWNFHYDEKEVNGETFLIENPERAQEAKAMLLLALSQGGIPLKLEDLAVSE